MRRLWLILAGCLGCVFAAAFCASPAHADPTLPGQSATCMPTAQSIGSELSVYPTSVTLGPDESSPVILEFSATCAPLGDITLHLYRNGAIRGVIVQPFPAELKVGQVGTSIVMLTGTELGLLSGSFTALVTATEGNPPQSVAGLVSVTVAERPADLLSLGTLTLPATPSSIDDQHPGAVVARVTNTSDTPIGVDSLEPTSTDSITVTADQTFKKFTLSPGESRDVEFTAKTSANFQEGSHVISLEAQVSTPDGARSQVLVSDKSVTVAVFGEAQITSAVGAISFLFVPGLLILVVFKLLWEQYSPRRTLSWLSPTNPEFWVAVITLSLVVIPLYYLTTAIYGPGRDLVMSFDSGDILRLWIASLVAGVIAWLVGLGWWRRRHIGPQDSARTVVRKLARRSSPILDIELADVTGQEGIFGIVGTLQDGVVIPSIQYSITSPEIKGQADDAVNSGDALKFWKAVRWGGNKVSLTFEKNRTIRQLPAAGVQDRGALGRIVTGAQ
jgi:hypothetical protein